MLRGVTARLLVATIIAMLSVGLAGGSFASVFNLVPSTASQLPIPGTGSPGRSAPGSPLGMLDSLDVAPEQRTGYSRELFEHWTDADGDGCDTRREVIIEEAVVAPEVAQGCWIQAGSWVSLYDGAVADNYPSKWEVDHLVALAEAWDSGASDWSAEKRRAFANDVSHPESLILASRSTNQAKSDHDPARWIPPARASRCGYLADWVRVKHTWGLSVDPKEKAALLRGLRSCPPDSTLVRG